jgi:hypothetical protein
MRALRLCTIAIACALALTTSLASAAGRKRKKDEDKRWVPAVLRTDIGLDTSFWSHSSNTTSLGVPGSTTLPFVIFGHSQITPGLMIDARLPFTFTAASEPISSEGKKVIGGLGNFNLSLYYARTQGIVTWWAGGGLGAPFASIKSLELQVADLLAWTAGGSYAPELWVPNEMPFLVKAGVELHVLPPLAVRLSFQPTFFIPVRGGGTGVVASTEQLEIEGRSRGGVGGGLGLQAFTNWTRISDLNSPDQAQLSTYAFFGYDDAESVFLRLGALLALDDPGGFGFDKGKVLTGFFTIGGYITPGGDDD